MWFVFSQIWYYTNGILREAGFAENILPYITLSTGAIETLAAIISVSIATLNQYQNCQRFYHQQITVTLYHQQLNIAR